jgi:hypothetical protein
MKKKIASGEVAKLKVPPGMKIDHRNKKLVPAKPPRIAKPVKPAREKRS